MDKNAIRVTPLFFDGACFPTALAVGKGLAPNRLTINTPDGQPIIEVDNDGIVTVGQDFIDKQPNETAKAILEALDRTVIPSKAVPLADLGCWNPLEEKTDESSNIKSELVFPRYNSYIEAIPPLERSEYYISYWYGTINPFVLCLWCKSGDVWYMVDEYYYSSKLFGRQQTDEEYYKDLKRFANGKEIKGIIADPTAASFIECIRRHGKYQVIPAFHHDIMYGINAVTAAFDSGKYKITPSCTHAIKEMKLYCLSDDGFPKKENDRVMTAIMLFVSTVLNSRKLGD